MKRRSVPPTETLRCVGGPLNGQFRTVLYARGISVPDRDDRQPHALSDGSLGWRYGVHHYERQLFARRGRGAIELLVYVKYTPAPLDIPSILAAGELQEEC